MTQKTTILVHLKKHKTISPKESWALYGIYRLSDIILKLRRDGHQIATDMRPAPNGSSYGEYRLG